MPELENPDIGSEFIAGMSRSAPFTALINAYHFNGAAEFQRDEIMTPLVEQIVGRQVRVTELEPARTSGAERPIQKFKQFSRAGLRESGRSETPRRIEGDRLFYLPASIRRYRESLEGTVLEADLNRQSLVLRPNKGLWVSRLVLRFWAAVVNEEGQPLIELRTLDEK